MPPTQSGVEKNWWWCRSTVRYITMDEPFGVQPYCKIRISNFPPKSEIQILPYTLCVSHEMDVTPARRKSNRGIFTPASSMNGIMKPPRHASTCTGMPYLRPSYKTNLINSIFIYF